MNKIQQIILLGIYLIILQVYDAILTNAIILEGGSEINPIVNFFMNTFGTVLGLIIIKAVAIIIIVTTTVYSTYRQATDKQIKLIRNLFIMVVTIYTIVMAVITIMHGM